MTTAAPKVIVIPANPDLVKSISRFARNTVDCLKYMRALKELGIAIIFEEQNLNTLDNESEMLFTLMSAFAQAESESISENVKWGKRQAMREGKAVIQYKHLYAYEKGPDGKPKIIPEQAEVVRLIYDSYLAGHSLDMIRKDLEDRRILTVSGGTKWSKAVVRGILQNEKYCGDVLQQKSFVNDCINRKHIRNVGQLPMYLTQDHHEGIVSRDTFNAVKAEFARRNSGRAPSQKQAPTGRSCYSEKYALTGRLVCGECGTLYRRCVWSKNGKKKAVWRCTSRIDYGTKYCHESPTLHEEPLKAAILAAINSAMSRRAALVEQIADSMRMELAPIPGETMSLSDIDQRLAELDGEFRELFKTSKEDGGYLKHAGGFQRFSRKHFPQQRQMDRDDYMIILGDFGGVWDGSSEERKQLDWLNEKPFTTLFVTGNHENYWMLRELPVEDWHGGKVQRVRLNILHLMRGQLYDIEGRTFFTMGGATSHDVEDGILDPNAPDFRVQYARLLFSGRRRFRIIGKSWWPEELPSDEEYTTALDTLERAGWKTDYVLTHCAPTSIARQMNRHYQPDALTDFLELVNNRLEFGCWLFGHYHDNREIDPKHILLWEQIVQLT